MISIFVRFNDKYILSVEREQKYIAVGTVKMFIETSAKHLQLPG